MSTTAACPAPNAANNTGSPMGCPVQGVGVRSCRQWGTKIAISRNTKTIPPMMAKRLLANRPARVLGLVGLVGLGSGGFIAHNLSIGMARARRTKDRKQVSAESRGLSVAKDGPYVGIEENSMRGSMTLAMVLLGLAPAWAAAGTAVAVPQAARSEHPPATATANTSKPTANVRASDIGSSSDRDSDSDERPDGDQKPRRPLSSPPASAETTPSAPQQPVFIISCNASGCTDNQGHFLTRSGPQHLVGPNGIRCQSMGGNWQCNAPTAP